VSGEGLQNSWEDVEVLSSGKTAVHDRRVVILVPQKRKSQNFKSQEPGLLVTDNLGPSTGIQCNKQVVKRDTQPILLKGELEVQKRQRVENHQMQDRRWLRVTSPARHNESPMFELLGLWEA
jgi:hypothetical protein